MKNIFLIIFFLISVKSFAQQGLQMQFPEQDSTAMEFEKQMEYRQLISGKKETQWFMESIELPDFDMQYEFDKRYKVSFDFFSFNYQAAGNFTRDFMFPVISPYFQSGTVLSEAAYQLGDKFVLGGYSYGINSIFTAPFPNNGMNGFDRYGSTMFLQYKVSKNFKIETRVNVTQGSHPGF